MENRFNGDSKTNKKNLVQDQTYFKINFLLPFAGCRKVLGKMPGYEHHNPELNKKYKDTRKLCNICSILF